jgi:anti-sigma factor (TIGR02949 family)
MSESLECREAIARLQDYLKQELTPERAGELRAHLEHCRPCEGYARFERSFLEMLEARAHHCCPEELRARVLRDLRIEMEQG